MSMGTWNGSGWSSLSLVMGSWYYNVEDCNPPHGGLMSFFIYCVHCFNRIRVIIHIVLITNRFYTFMDILVWNHMVAHFVFKFLICNNRGGD